MLIVRVMSAYFVLHTFWVTTGVYWYRKIFVPDFKYIFVKKLSWELRNDYIIIEYNANKVLIILLRKMQKAVSAYL